MSFAWIIVTLSLGSFLIKFIAFPSLLHSEVFACLSYKANDLWTSLESSLELHSNKSLCQ